MVTLVVGALSYVRGTPINNDGVLQTESGQLRLRLAKLERIGSLGLYSKTLPRALWWPDGGGLFLMSKVHLSITMGLCRRKVGSCGCG